MLKNLISFFTKKENNQKNSVKKDIDYENLYLEYVENYTWEDYQKLNKYKKVFAFSVQNINDIEIIENIRNAYFNPISPYNRNKLDQEVKTKIKLLNISLKDIPFLVTNNMMILSNLRRYIQSKDLPLSKYIRITSPLLGVASEGEITLHNFVFHVDDESLSYLYPPNFPNDKSHTQSIRESLFDKLKVDLKKQTIASPHDDYDFNIPKYIIEKLELTV